MGGGSLTIRCKYGNIVLIAKRHSAEVKELRDILNSLTAPDGRPYNFRLTTWDEEGFVIRQSA